MTDISNNLTCQGCIENQQNQLAHMDYGGCLYSSNDYDNTTYSREEIMNIFNNEQNRLIYNFYGVSYEPGEMINDIDLINDVKFIGQQITNFVIPECITKLEKNYELVG